MKGSPSDPIKFLRKELAAREEEIIKKTRFRSRESQQVCLLTDDEVVDFKARIDYLERGGNHKKALWGMDFYGEGGFRFEKKGEGLFCGYPGYDRIATPLAKKLLPELLVEEEMKKARKREREEKGAGEEDAVGEGEKAKGGKREGGCVMS